jgi:hypothetical protein
VSITITEISEESTTAEEALTDWSFSENPAVIAVIERAARTAAGKYGDTGTAEYGDALQDGMILVATKRDLQDAVARVDAEPGLLYARLGRDLTNLYQREAEKRVPARRTSWEANQAALESQGL